MLVDSKTLNWVEKNNPICYCWESDSHHLFVKRTLMWFFSMTRKILRWKLPLTHHCSTLIMRFQFCWPVIIWKWTSNVTLASETKQLSSQRKVLRKLFPRVIKTNRRGTPALCYSVTRDSMCYRCQLGNTRREPWECRLGEAKGEMIEKYGFPKLGRHLISLSDSWKIPSSDFFFGKTVCFFFPFLLFKLPLIKYSITCIWGHHVNSIWLDMRSTSRKRETMSA